MLKGSFCNLNLAICISHATDVFYDNCFSSIMRNYDLVYLRYLIKMNEGHLQKFRIGVKVSTGNTDNTLWLTDVLSPI